MNNNFGLFLAMLIMVTVFAPLFIDRGYRSASRSLKEFRQGALRKVARKAFALYAIGATLYLAGLMAALPWALMGSSSFPNVIRGEAHSFVIYNTFTLNQKEFLIYFAFLVPIFLVSSAFGIWRFEKSFEEMWMVERAMKDKFKTSSGLAMLPSLFYLFPMRGRGRCSNKT